MKRWTVAAAAAIVLAGAALAEEKEKPKGVEAGADAPDFRLNDDGGKAVRLSDLRGKSWAVLAFFPKAMTPGWTIEVCSLRDAAKELEALGAKVLAVSLDDVASQREFVKQQSLTFPLLSDPDGSAAGKYGVLYADKPYARRVTFLVDPRGVVRLVDAKVKPDSHGRDLIEALKRLKGG